MIDWGLIPRKDKKGKNKDNTESDSQTIRSSQATDYNDTLLMVTDG
jgi:hypothetical protein